jgi:carbon-monoxide dehydrogenase medium subunit
MIYLKSLPEFEYFAPKTMHEASAFLGDHEEEAKVLAGGTDLLVHMKHRAVVPRYLVGLKTLQGLDRITYSTEEGLRIGPLVSHQSIAEDPVITERFGALAFACSKVGTPQIRSMGTIGGNLCNGSPSADSAPPLIAMGTLVKLSGLAGERVVPLEDFFTGPGKTVLTGTEILCELHVPSLQPQTGVVYEKLAARAAVDIAAVGVAVLVSLDQKSEICRDVRIVLGAVSPTPLRARAAEQLLRGKKMSEDLISEAAQGASKEAHPITDVRSTAIYRTEMVKVLTRNALKRALKGARSI